MPTGQSGATFPPPSPPLQPLPYGKTVVRNAGAGPITLLPVPKALPIDDDAWYH